MLLILPDVSVTIGPTWASNLNTALQAVDQHDHSDGKGTPVTPAGLDMNQDLPMDGNNLTEARSVRFNDNGAALTGSDDYGSVYFVGGELYATDGAGNDVQITSSGSVNVSGVGGITGLSGTTGAVTYSDVTKVFTFTQSAGVVAKIDCGDLTIRDTTVSSGKGVILKVAASHVADITITLPGALPAASHLVTLNASGIMAVADDPVIASRPTFDGVNPGTTADTTAGNIRWASPTLQVRQSGAWQNLVGNVVTIGNGTTTFGDYNGTDETPFTSAIAALSSGGTIFVRRGTYTFAAPFSISTAGIRIVGEGRDSTTIIGASSSAFNSTYVVNIAAANVSIEDIKVSAPAATATGTAYAVNIANAGTRAIVRNCWITNPSTAATNGKGMIVQGPYSTIDGCRFDILKAATGNTTIALDVSANLVATGDLEGIAIINNLFKSNTGNGTTGTTKFVRLLATGSSTGTDVAIQFCIVNNNRVETGTTYNYFIEMRGVNGGAPSNGDGVIKFNTVVGNEMFATGASGSVIRLDSDDTDTITRNCFMGNFGSSFSYNNIATTINSTRMAADGGFIASTSGGAVTLQVDDEDFNQF